MTPDAADLLGAWERVLRELRGAAGAAPSEAARALTSLVQRQAELLQEVLERQARFEQEVVGRALAPVDVVVDLVDQSAGAMRAQAKALDGAATSFRQASELLELQAALLERTVQALRDPVAVLRAAGSAVVRRGDADAVGDADADRPPPRA